MKYYINLIAIYGMLIVAITAGTIVYASLFDPEAEALVKLFVDCVVKILLMGH